MSERKKAKIVPVAKVSYFENENNYSNPSISPRSKKIKVRYDIEIIRLERIPKKLVNDGVIIYWKKKGAHAYLTTKKETGQTVPIVLTSPVTNFQKQDNNSLSFSTHLFVFKDLIFNFSIYIFIHIHMIFHYLNELMKKRN